MDQQVLENLLSDLPLGDIRYHDSIGSTNTSAAQWANAGAPDLSLVAADEQTAGRGRRGRRWFTPPGAALAFSLLIHLRGHGDHARQNTCSQPFPETKIPLLTALGAVAVSAAMRQQYGLVAEIKWPNDVLLNLRKVAGVLVETQWHGEQPTNAIIGIGINIAADSIPQKTDLHYPATCAESVLGGPVDRWALLHTVLEVLLAWRPRLASPEFLQVWGNQLAFQGHWVQVCTQESAGSSQIEGTVVGITPEGSLMLRTRSGDIVSVHSSAHLRPIDKMPE